MKIKKGLVFSVVIPAYNEEKYIGKALKSVLEQDFPREKYEVIVVNNGSSDKTGEIVKKYKVRLINLEEKGLKKARREGYRKARGKYVVNLDADCVVDKDWLGRIQKHFENNLGIVGVGGATYAIGSDMYSRVILKYGKLVHWLCQKVFGNPLLIWPCNVAVKKIDEKKIFPDEYMKTPDSTEVLYWSIYLKRLGKIYYDKDLLVRESHRRYKKGFFWLIVKDGLPIYINFFAHKLIGRPIFGWKEYR